MNKQKKQIILMCGSLVFLSACGGSDNNPEVVVVEPPPVVTAPVIDDELSALILANNLIGNAFADRDTPDINSDIAQLGKHLFFSKSLSGDRDVACVTCHHPMLGSGDNLSLPVGVGAEIPDLLGVGRLHSADAEEYDGGPPVPRNSPSVFNLAGWDKVLFNDGRIESIGKTANSSGNDGFGIDTPETDFGIVDPTGGQSLAHAQARFPVTSNEEMKGFNHQDKTNAQIRQFLAERLGDYGEAAGELQMPEFWLNKFKVAFMQPDAAAEQLITEQNISFALGQYQLSQVFVNTPWRQYIEGDTQALTDAAKRGAKLFYGGPEQGGANCASCHSGDFFTDERFHNIAAPQIGRGKGDGDSGHDDFGRFRVTGVEQDKYAFRTPTLLNVAQTGPWMHAGAYTDLFASVRHSLNPLQGIHSYDISQLDQPGIQNLGEQLLFGENAQASDNFNGNGPEFDDGQVEDLIAFLNALTDPCVLDRVCMAPWLVVDDDSQDPNGDQLNAVDQNGDPL